MIYLILAKVKKFMILIEELIDMDIDYQIVVDLISNIGIVVFPISLIFCICERLVDIFLGFVSGKRVKL